MPKRQPSISLVEGDYDSETMLRSGWKPNLPTERDNAALVKFGAAALDIVQEVFEADRHYARKVARRGLTVTLEIAEDPEYPGQPSWVRYWLLGNQSPKDRPNKRIAKLTDVASRKILTEALFTFLDATDANNPTSYGAQVLRRGLKLEFEMVKLEPHGPALQIGVDFLYEPGKTEMILEQPVQEH